MRTLSQLDAAIAKQEDAIAKQEEEARIEGHGCPPKEEEMGPTYRSLNQDQTDAHRAALMGSGTGLDAMLSRPLVHDRAYFLAYGFMSYIEPTPNPNYIKILADLLRQEAQR